MNAASLTSAFTAPADFRLESCSPESGLSELDGTLELDGLELGPELQFLLESHMSQSPTHSDSHLLDSLDKVRCLRKIGPSRALYSDLAYVNLEGLDPRRTSTHLTVIVSTTMHDQVSMPISFSTLPM